MATPTAKSSGVHNTPQKRGRLTCYAIQSVSSLNDTFFCQINPFSAFELQISDIQRIDYFFQLHLSHEILEFVKI